MVKVFFAADHAGFELKTALVPYVKELGHEPVDCGAETFSAGDDYPDFITPCAEQVAADGNARGIIIGASGEGEAMAANRVKGVRAAVYYGEAKAPQTDTNGKALGIIESSRAHNDANVLSLGARFITVDEAKEAVRRFLSTPFSGDERHARRLAKF